MAEPSKYNLSKDILQFAQAICNEIGIEKELDGERELFE